MVLDDIGTKLSKAFTPDNHTDNLYTNLSLDYYGTHLIINSQFNQIGKNYIAAMGFTPRLFNYDAATGQTLRLGYYENTSHIEYDILSEIKTTDQYARIRSKTTVFLNSSDGSLNEVASGFQIFYPVCKSSFLLCGVGAEKSKPAFRNKYLQRTE